ncbi:helix-turn-helix domain-containing protein [Streptomyces mobaraensis]|uniref:helix-turn-helix domain-containing protein n=1 Tax=Streptomyces mobaraensis TaxID=35621 RepID=UPI001F03BCE9|nr:helix-turn-helix domain-containing protein [Streptomyces mobaraensis]
MDRYSEHGDERAPEGRSARAARPPLARIAASIRTERDHVGLSLSELAKRAGIAKSTLSQLESGTGNPSVETLWALSVALDVPFSRLVDPPRPRVTVLRLGEGAAVPSEHADYTATLLASCPPHARRDLYVLQVEPGALKASDSHAPGTTEHAVIASGRALIGPTDEPLELGPGDYISYPGDAPHICQALEPGTVIVLAMEHT